MLSSDSVYGVMNGCNMAVKQIQKGLTGLHLISRMLKVRLKQICGGSVEIQNQIDTI